MEEIEMEMRDTNGKEEKTYSENLINKKKATKNLNKALQERLCYFLKVRYRCISDRGNLRFKNWGRRVNF